MAAPGARSIDASAIFRVFTACLNDPVTLLLDVRPQKDFKKKHINQAFNVRLSTNGQVLADYSQSSYSVRWAQAVWWGKPVIVYGPAGLSKSHPVVEFLVKEGRCAAVLYFKEGYEAFEKQYPFLCTPSVKANSIKKYPSQVLDHLYLGDWAHAVDQERLDELKVKRIITIHNNPENLKPPAHIQHLRFTLADVETADISCFLSAAYEFIDEGLRKGEGVLVHCGAGVSRSACLVMMYLMRSKHWGAQRAREYVTERRSLVCPNDGFWRTLCSLEAGLGIANRSDPSATSGFAGADAPAAKLSEDALGAKVHVQFEATGTAGRDADGRQRREDEGGSGRAREGRHREGVDDRRQGREGSRLQDRSMQERARGHSRERRRSRSRDRSRSRERGRDAGRERGSSRDRGRHHSRERSRERGRRRSRSPQQERGRNREAGDTRETVTRNGGEPAAAAQQPASTAGAAAGWQLKLEVSKPEGVLGTLRLGPLGLHQRVVFGRDPNCEVVLEHLSVSRRHAQLGVDANGGVTVTDLGSAHGTKVGEVWVKAHAPRALGVGETLRFGASTRLYKLLLVERMGS